ncbi:hypothetical protein I3842_16G023300 [Carya illinoinensis]|uniref:Peptidase S26 domain-containing protein n=2 Tax=Carya illinoinensis TaxID=32201 RepID=A0A922D8C0_CARIL|nr:hypothetical protein I3842_16G023300 [Carya illinoinensis]
MSFLRPSALYQFLITSPSLRWMPCQSWGFLRWPGLDGLLRLFVVLLLWSTFSEIRHIPSSSMFPTLRVGDRIIVERASYYFVSPAIHDIVTFRDPTQVNHGLLYVNGIAQKEDFIAECPTYKSNLTNSIAGLELLGANEFHKTAQRSMMFHAMCLPCHWSSSSWSAGLYCWLVSSLLQDSR